MTRPATLVLLVLCLLLPAYGLAQAGGNAAKGKGVFMKNCMLCHNADGSGGKKYTPTGNPSRDFRDPKFWAERTDAQVREVINKGVLKSGMIGWKGILKPQEIEDVIAYVKTFAKKPEAPPAAAAPAPSATPPTGR